MTEELTTNTADMSITTDNDNDNDNEDDNEGVDNSYSNSSAALHPVTPESKRLFCSLVKFPGMYVGVASASTIIAGLIMGAVVVVFDTSAEDGATVEHATEAIDAIEASTRALISVGHPITGGDFGVSIVDDDVLLILVCSIVGFSIGAIVVFIEELSTLFPFPIIQPTR
jgi:hypothetical protein